MMKRTALLSLVVLGLCACKKEPLADKPSATQPPKAASHVVGLVTDVGGRGDQSFNDSALRGLELWAGGKRFAGGEYQVASADQVRASLSADLLALSPPIEPLGVTPLIVQSKAQEDYEPNLQLLVDQGASLIVGVGFMLENAVEAVAKRNAQARFLLIDSPILDKAGKPQQLPNVRTVVFREEEGSYLVGALAGLVTTKHVGFVGGMEIPLIKKFEAGFRAGVKTTRADADVLVSYTGSFDNVAAGKQIAQDMLAKGVDVIFQAAGSDGLGVIQAVKEARAAGKMVWVIGVDSDQSHLAPDAVLTSMVKRVDLAVYQAARDLSRGQFTAGDVVLGLKDGGVTWAPVRVEFPNKASALERMEELKRKVISGEIKVPSHPSALEALKP